MHSNKKAAKIAFPKWGKGDRAAVDEDVVGAL